MSPYTPAKDAAAIGETAQMLSSADMKRKEKSMKQEHELMDPCEKCEGRFSCKSNCRVKMDYYRAKQRRERRERIINNEAQQNSGNM